MLITVAICTLNRAESLRRTLKSLAAMQVPDDLDWEVVVVNNGCTDHTDDVIEAFADRLPIRRESVPVRGKSRACNRAVEVARGDYIIWTDDDVAVDPGWLAAYAEAFRRWPEAAVFGGKVVERFAEPLPKWLEGNKTFPGFAARDFGDETLPLSIPELRIPFGANLAVRASDQRNFLYDPDLGPGAATGFVGEERDVIEKILQTGAAGYWIPKSTVTHYIGHERLTLDYVASLYTAIGKSELFRSREPVAPAQHMWFGAPRWLWRRLAEEWVRYRIHRLISPASVWLPHFQKYSLNWGKIQYWRSECGRRAG
jgi:glycosyltransferase involved in cell wall biosynthesis